MNRYLTVGSLLLFCSACVDGSAPNPSGELTPVPRGPYPVGSTNMEIMPSRSGMGDDDMHAYLLGAPAKNNQPRFVSDLLEHPDAAWVTQIPVPDAPELYGPASGQTLPVVSFIVYPSAVNEQPNHYEFPYHDAEYGSFEDMLSPGESPQFADPHARYPLILLSHGASAHGVYDVRHAHTLASHGYIVAVLNYGDERTAIANTRNQHLSHLRPFLTSAVLDTILDSDEFGGHIDTGNIGITGHSFGGFTALALTGGPVDGHPASVTDDRIKASVIAAPWVGGMYEDREMFAFGPENSALSNVKAPTLVFFGTKDTVTLASFILPAAKKLSGPTYVVELVDQPHVFEGGSWIDRDNWELLFFSAYLQGNEKDLARLKTLRSMEGGNDDVQLFEYQK